MDHRLVERFGLILAASRIRLAAGSGHQNGDQ